MPGLRWNRVAENARVPRGARAFVRFWERALWGVGLVLLGGCLAAWLDARAFQQREERSLAQLRGAARERVTPGTGGLASAAASNRPARPVSDPGLIGRLEIPRLGLSAIVREGTTGRTLARAVGHVAGTALPGTPGNVGLAAHRDTFFRQLEGVHKGDPIRITTPDATWDYVVESIRVVDPDAVRVLAQDGAAALTLVTCYPFHYLGPAPRRFIVRALQRPAPLAGGAS